MSASEGALILKLGGSLLTHKDRPLKAKRKKIKALANFLSKEVYPYKKKLILIHGGGSFGHYEAMLDVQKHGALSYEGLPRVSWAMVLLNQIVLQELVRAGLPAVSLPPRAFCHYDCNTDRHICEYKSVYKALENGLLPILFGDIIIGERGCGPRIISGDDIAVDIAKLIGGARIVFAMDVEGIYTPSFEGRFGPLIRQMSVSQASGIIRELERVGKVKGYDVTGGIASKLRKSISCLEAGFCSEVVFVSGERKESLHKAIFGIPGDYTVIKVSH